MSLIDEIRAKIAERRYELSVHASDQCFARGMSVWDIVDALGAGEVIEDYPDDKYGPGCLIFGSTELGSAAARALQLSVSPAAQNHHGVRT